MLQTIDGKQVFVVEFDTVPETPIRGLTPEEIRYNDFILRVFGRPELVQMFKPHLLFEGDSLYAQALTAAIDEGVITEGGKYAIHIAGDRWEVARVIE